MAAVLITRGSRGMALFEPGRPTVHIPIVGSDEIADVTGAGDTVIATVTLALASGASMEEAAHLANHAGGLVVMKRGTATVSRDELGARSAIEGETVIVRRATSCCAACRGAPRPGTHHRAGQRLSSISSMSVTCATCRARPPRPTCSIVAVNDDAAVRQLKGDDRPIVGEAERAELVDALSGVDYVVLFGDLTVGPLLEALRPDVHCKGTDYTVDTVPERAIVQAVRRTDGDRRRPEGPLDARHRGATDVSDSFLIVRLGALGDIVHAIPVVAALREAVSVRWRIGWLVHPRSCAAAAPGGGAGSACIRWNAGRARRPHSRRAARSATPCASTSRGC